MATKEEENPFEQKNKKMYLGLALVILLAASAGGLFLLDVIVDVYGDSNVREEQDDMDMDFHGVGDKVTLTAESRHEFEDDFEDIEDDGIDHFVYAAESDYCLGDEKNDDGDYYHEVWVNTQSDSVTVKVDVPEVIYCVVDVEGIPIPYPMVYQGSSAYVDLNGVEKDDLPSHFRDSKHVDCDSDGGMIFNNLEMVPDQTTGYVNVISFYEPSFGCEGISLEGSKSVMPLPNRNTFYIN